MTDKTESDIREQEARIRQLQADVNLRSWEALKRAQEVRYAPWALVASGVGATAALFGAAIALLKWVQ